MLAVLIYILSFQSLWAVVQGVHHQKQNMVLFGAAGIAGRPRLHAIVSRYISHCPPS